MEMKMNYPALKDGALHPRVTIKQRTAWVLALGVFLVSAGGPGLFAEEPVFSGVFDSTVIFEGGAGEAPAISYGIEEYLNLRFRAAVGDKGTFHGALNLIALSGNSLENAAALAAAATAAAGAGGNLPAASSLAVGENYAAILELERLYFRVNGDYTDWEAGLLRLAFGYGRVFSPSDFLNPRNPLFPDARPRAVLGSALAAYPAGETKVQVFAAAPKNPFNTQGGGLLFGASAERHGERASIQGLYAFETPPGSGTAGSGTIGSGTIGSNGVQSSGAVHRGGLSLKADWELGFTADVFYTWEQGAKPDIEGLAASAGFDYSFGDGDFYVLTEYLFSGLSSVSSAQSGNLSGFSNRNYLYGSVLYHFNDYTNASAALLFGLDDSSFTPLLSVNYELFQGFTLGLTGQVPLDRDVFSKNGKRGELGPLPPGTDRGRRLRISAQARLRF
jgi:hypothetical protein